MIDVVDGRGANNPGSDGEGSETPLSDSGGMGSPGSDGEGGEMSFCRHLCS